MRILFYFKICLLAATVVVLNACVNSTPPPDTFYYVLDPAPQTFTAKTNARPYKVKPVMLPDYMNQPNLVLKLNDHQIKITNYHFWAADLRQSVQSVLINELNLINSGASFSKNCSQCTEITVYIQHYYPTESGDVVLSGSYQINSDKQNQSQYSFSFNSSLQKGGYDEAVAAMRMLLDELAIDINKRL